MNGTTNDSDTLRAILSLEADERRGGHLQVEQLASYDAGALDAASEETVREHLSCCRKCADRLLDLAPLIRPEAPRIEGVADLEIELAWREFRARSASRTESAWNGRRSPLVALAASLAVAALALAIWGVRLRQANAVLERTVADATAPVVNMPQLFLDEPFRGEEASDRLFEVPETASHFVVYLAVVDPLPADEYEVRFVDASGREALSVDGLVMSGGGSLRLGLPRGLLPEGDYLIRVRGLWDGEWRPVAEHRRTLKHIDRPTISEEDGGPRPR